MNQTVALLGTSVDVPPSGICLTLSVPLPEAQIADQTNPMEKVFPWIIGLLLHRPSFQEDSSKQPNRLVRLQCGFPEGIALLNGDV